MRACLALLALLPATLPAQERRLERLVPEGSFGYFRFEGLAACRRLGSRLPVLKLATDLFSRLPFEVREEALAEIREGQDRFKEGAGAVGLPPKTLHRLLRRPALLSFGRPTLLSQGIRKGSFFGILPSLLLVVDVRGAEEEARQVVELLESVLLLQGPQVVRKQESAEGRALTVLRSRRGFGSLAHALSEGYLFLGLGAPYLREALGCLSGGKEPLALPATIRRVASSLPSEPFFSCFLDTRPLLDWLAPFIPYEIQEAGRILGLTGMDGIYYACGASGGDWFEVEHYGLRGNREGMLQALLGQPASFGAASHCPKDTLGFLTFRMDCRALAERGRDLIALLPEAYQERLLRDLERGLRQASQRLGIDPGEWPRLFGSEVTLASSLPSPRDWIPVLAFLEVRDEQKVEDLLLSLLANLPLGRVYSQEVSGKRIHFLSPRGQRDMKFSPAFTLVDGHLVLSPFAKSLKERMGQWPMPQESLFVQPDFRRMLQESAEASAFFTIRAREFANRGWKQLSPFLVTALEEGTNFRLGREHLPTGEELARGLPGFWWSGRWGADGFQGRAMNYPFGLAFPMLAAGSFADWFLEGASGRSLR